MIFKRIKSNGIAHNSYLIGDRNEVAVIDPRRDCQIYVDTAQNEGLKIKYIFETHRNEDYVIGSLELKKKTGAEIFHGPGLGWKYGNTLSDGEVFRIGSLNLKAIHTPGHTDESMSYAITDLSTGNSPIMVFTGDSLFVQDVGRTDLYGEKETSRLSSNLYDSVFNKLLPLGDGVIICPAHGGGSVCGANIAARDESTIGIEKIQNPVLNLASKEDFVIFKLEEKLEKPYYFTQIEKYNLEGPPILGYLPQPDPLSPREFKDQLEKGAIIVDTSEPFAFGGSHIKGAYSIWGDGLSPFAGWMLSYGQPILLVLDYPGRLDAAVRDLVRLGFDSINGYLKGGIDSWNNAGFPMERSGLLSVQDLKSMLDRHEEFFLLDVRGQREWDSGYIEGASHIYVGHLAKQIAEIPRGKTVVVYCSTGHRSGLGASILLRAGFSNVFNLLGGISAWTAAGFSVVEH